MAMIGGCAPLCLRQWAASNDMPLVLGTMFGGGVFVAAGFIHLLGDAAKSLDPADGYPYAMLACALGVLAPLCIDSLAARLLNPRRQVVQVGPPCAPGACPAPAPAALAPSRSMRADSDFLVSSIVLHDADADRSSRRSTGRPHGASMLSDPGCTAAAGDNHGGEPSRVVSLVGILVLFLALTLHSFIAGLVLGVSGDTFGLFIAIIAHKSFAAWSLGCSFARSDQRRVPPRAAALWVLSFASTTPLGIIIGTALSEANWVDDAFTSTLVALAAGFFLYVGLMEVIAKEMADDRWPLLKLTMMLLGFGLMAMLAIWT